MNSPDQPEITTESFDGVHEVPFPKPHTDSRTRAISSVSQSQESNFDWTALGIVVIIAAFFAITARFHAQPATSFVPVAVLSATGCGLLVTAIRKLHTSKGVGLLEAALGGFFMALLQFTVALTYPGVFDSISFSQTLRDDFLISWTLIAVFSIIFSLAGATLGHLSFAPLRPLPARSSSTDSLEEETVNTVSRHMDEYSTVGTSDHDITVEDLTEKPFTHQSQRSVIALQFFYLAWLPQ